MLFCVFQTVFRIDFKNFRGSFVLQTFRAIFCELKNVSWALQTCHLNMELKNVFYHEAIFDKRATTMEVDTFLSLP